MLLTKDLPQPPFLGTQEKGRAGTRGADTYPGIAGSEPRGLHSSAGDGASGHYLGQDGPIAAFLIVIWVPVGRERKHEPQKFALTRKPTPLRSSASQQLDSPYLVTARGRADLGSHTTIWELWEQTG